MNKLQDMLKCAMCNQTFTSAPVVLDCCNVNICEHHVKENVKTNKKRKLFTCSLCEASHHVTNNKKFALNKTIENLLEIELAKMVNLGPTLVNLGEIFNKTNEEIKNLEFSSQKSNDLIKDPKNFIFETIAKLKRDVDLRREKLKEKIDEISIKMIDKLDNYQQECYDNIDKINLEEKTKDLVKEIESDLYEWTKDDKRMLIISEDSKRREIHTKAIQLDTKLVSLLKEVKEELMMNREWIYLENENIHFNEYEKELIQFEG